jgi:uncharacterized membrane protein
MRHFRLIVIFAAVAIMAVSLPAFSQSCALCYTQAASGTAKFISALRSGIILLMIPPLVISAGLVYFAYRKRNQFQSFHDWSESGNGW